MDRIRRFVFQGHAVALGGRIVRIGQGRQAKFIDDGFVDLPASALTVSGGRSTTRVERGYLKGVASEFVQFGLATTETTGVYTDDDAVLELSQNDRPPDQRSYRALSPKTQVQADVQELVIGSSIKFVARRIRAGLGSTVSSRAAEVPFKIDPDTIFDQLEFVDANGNRFPLTVEIDRAFYDTRNTHGKLEAAAAGRGNIIAKGGHALLRLAAAAVADMKPAQAKRGTKSAARPPAKTPATVLAPKSTVIGTIVTFVDWTDPERKFPGATIEGNKVRIPDFGSITLGEFRVSPVSRRLTMVQSNMGSPMGGDTDTVDLGDGGGWSF